MYPLKYSESRGAYAIFSFRALPWAPGVSVYGSLVRQPKVLTLFPQEIFGFYGGAYAIFNFRELPRASAGSRSVHVRGSRASASFRVRPWASDVSMYGGSGTVT